MALITEFEPITKQTPKIHKPVQCGYCSFLGPGDKRYLLLETYGSADRQFPGKTSQSLQLDENAAAQLIGIIRGEFPNLA